MRILILHPGALGDIILSLPAVALLRESLPSAELSVAGHRDYLEPVMGGLAERLLSLSVLPLHHFYTPDAPPPEAVRFWSSFDRVVSWTGAGDPVFESGMRRIHPESLIAAWRPAPGETRHVAQIFVDSLRPWISPDAKAAPVRIRVESSARRRAEQWLRSRGWTAGDRLAALHPGAGSPVKRWPLVCYIRLAERLLLEGPGKMLVIEGPAEDGIADQMAGTLKEGRAIAVRSAPPALVAALLERCEVFIGNDSGVAHLAAGLGVPSVVLFGPTLPQHWAPLGEHVAVLRDARGCEACAFGRGGHTCLSNITVARVLRCIQLHKRGEGRRLASQRELNR